MLTEKTVLILGAGSSIPYGFPSGQGLKIKICRKLGDASGINQLRDLGFHHDKIEEFAKALYFSGKPSVDAFLENRKEFLEVGKAAIAQTLIPYENVNRLFSQEESFKKSDWYEYLYAKLNAPFKDFEKNKISIITYNYDRSLEQYLFIAITNTYGIKNEKDVASKLKKIPIIHLHGHLGNLSWQDSSWRPYSPHVDLPALKKGSQYIKIIYEDIGRDPEFKRAYEIMKEADHIYFLGFGYNETNLKRLQVNAIQKSQNVWGSSYGFTDKERIDTKGNSKGKINLEGTGLDVLGFLRNVAVLR